MKRTVVYGLVLVAILVIMIVVPSQEGFNPFKSKDWEDAGKNITKTSDKTTSSISTGFNKNIVQPSAKGTANNVYKPVSKGTNNLIKGADNKIGDPTRNWFQTTGITPAYNKQTNIMNNNMREQRKEWRQDRKEQRREDRRRNSAVDARTSSWFEQAFGKSTGDKPNVKVSI